MRGLERDLRDVLEREAGEAITEAPHRMPDHLHRRIRSRVTRTAVGGVATVAVLIGTVVGISRLGWVGGSDEAGPAGLGADPPEFVVASGETAANFWTLVAIQRPNEWCLEFRLTEPVSAICEGSSPWEERLAIGTGYLEDPTEGGLLFLFGAAPPVVEAMDYELKGGEVIEIAVGTANPLPGDARFLPFHQTLAPQAGTILAYSENGQTPILRQYFAPVPPPGPPPMSELTPVADHFGNSVGEVRGEDLFAPPPPPGTEDRSFGWTPPGLEASVEELRRVVRTPLALVWSEVGDWWARRPGDASRPQELRAWWDAYPVDAYSGLALGEAFYKEDANGSLWAKLAESDAITIRHATPGAGEELAAANVRIVAGARIPYIAPEVWEWWASRPAKEASATAFLEWWQAYPLG
jgi:hypothetical protein